MRRSCAKPSPLADFWRNYGVILEVLPVTLHLLGGGFNICVLKRLQCS
jgi:hypothetical protein